MAADEAVDPVRVMVSDYHALERALRAAFAASGRLSVSTAEAHAAMRLGGLAGHQVFDAIGVVHARLGDAIGTAAGGHRQLEALGRKLGLDVAGYGDGQKPPSAVFPSEADVSRSGASV